MTAALIVDFEEKSSTGPIAAEEAFVKLPLSSGPLVASRMAKQIGHCK
jgi:hypothetical protein